MTAHTLTQSSSLITTLTRLRKAPSESRWRPHALTDLSVRALPDDKWRVRDDRRKPDDPAGLLGYIERLTGETIVFEVMTLPGGFEWHSYDSLREAIESFVDEPRPTVPR